MAYGRVQILARRPSAGAVAAALSVPGPGTYTLSPAATSLRLRCGALGQEDSRGAFDADALGWPLVLRARRSGDRMRPRGGRGSRKLADLLIDAKVPRARRDTLPVLTTADDIVLFVPGLRPAEEGRPTARTTRFLRVAPLDPAET